MAEQWEGEHGYSPKNHDHDSKYAKLGHVHDYAASNHNHDDVYSKLGHSHELLDMLPIGTVLWFKSNVTLSDKWTVYTDLIGRYPLGSTSNLGSTVEAGLPNITGEIKGHAAGTDGAYGGTFRGVHQSGASLDDLTTGSFVVGDKSGGSSGLAYTPDSDTYTLKFDASQCSTVYKDDCDTVTPPSVNLIPYIKIA